MNGNNLISDLAKQKVRLDERKNFDGYREIKIEYGLSENAAGSAKVTLGDTVVMCGIKFDVDKPFPDSEDEGVLITNAEFCPIASPEFEPGPPKEDAIELARVVDRGIRESHAIDFTKLCIKKGEKIWVVYVDLYILNHDGNLIDAAALAAIAALNKAVLPVYDEEKEMIDKEKQGKEKLKLTCLPMACTFAKFDDIILPDPCKMEEEQMKARLTIATAEKNIHSMQLGGNDGMTVAEIHSCVDRAFELAKDLRKLIK